MEEEMLIPELNVPCTYKVGEQCGFQPGFVKDSEYMEIKSVVATENDKFKITFMYSVDGDTDNLKSYEVIVSNGDLIDLTVFEEDSGFFVGYAIYPCKVKVTDISEISVTLTMVEKGDENLELSK